MPDEEMATALEALEAVLIGLIEHAHEIAVASPPGATEAHRERVGALRQVGADIALLANACAVLARVR